MRISDWSSDVCSSDLSSLRCSTSQRATGARSRPMFTRLEDKSEPGRSPCSIFVLQHGQNRSLDRKSVVSGTSVSVRVDLGGRGIITKKKNEKSNEETTPHKIQLYYEYVIKVML